MSYLQNDTLSNAVYLFTMSIKHLKMNTVQDWAFKKLS